MYLKVAKLSYIILGDFFNCQISCSIGMLIKSLRLFLSHVYLFSLKISFHFSIKLRNILLILLYPKYLIFFLRLFHSHIM